jgi:hypothetical protein
MGKPTDPESVLLDFQYETTPLVHLAQHIEDDRDVPEQARNWMRSCVSTSS